MLLLTFILGACWGAILTWAVAYWCTNKRTAAALFVRQTLNLSTGPIDPPPPV